LGLDSGTRGYNPRCRDTVALPPPSSLEWAKARLEREKADIWLNPRGRRRGRRDPGRRWAFQAFIKTPAPLPHPSSPPAPGPGPGTVFRAAPITGGFFLWQRSASAESLLWQKSGTPVPSLVRCMYLGRASQAEVSVTVQWIHRADCCYQL
jgi:hypothetical protein